MPNMKELIKMTSRTDESILFNEYRRVVDEINDIVSRYISFLTESGVDVEYQSRKWKRRARYRDNNQSKTSYIEDIESLRAYGERIEKQFEEEVALAEFRKTPEFAEKLHAAINAIETAKSDRKTLLEAKKAEFDQCMKAFLPDFNNSELTLGQYRIWKDSKESSLYLKYDKGVEYSTWGSHYSVGRDSVDALVAISMFLRDPHIDAKFCSLFEEVGEAYGELTETVNRNEKLIKSFELGRACG